MADHVGIYEIGGTVVPTPTTVPMAENAYVNPDLPQTVVGFTNRRTFDRRTILRFATNTSSSIAPEASGNIPYNYGRGNVSPPPSASSYTSGVLIASSRDQNFAFAIGEYAADLDDLSQYWGVFPSGTELVENTPVGVDPAYTPTRTKYFREGRYRTTPASQPIYEPVLSGSAFDYSQRRNHTVGITSHTSSDTFTIAVFTRLSGNIATTLSSAGSSTDPGWFLGYYLSSTYGIAGGVPITYGGGIPYLPVSSGTLTSSQDPVVVDTSASLELLRQTVDIPTIVPPANDVTALLNRQDYTMTTDQRWQAAVSPTSSSGNYFGV